MFLTFKDQIPVLSEPEATGFYALKVGNITCTNTSGKETTAS